MTESSSRAPRAFRRDSPIAAGSAGRQRARARLLLALACLPPILLAWLVYRFGVDVPLRDEWALAYDIERFFDGDWSAAEVLRADHGERLALPRIVMVPLAAATGWNVRLEMALGLALGVACAALVAAATRDLARTVSPPGRAAYLLFASVLLFSLAPVESWLSGLALPVMLALLFSLGALAALRRDAVGATELGGALLACIGAAASQASGLVAFVAAGVVLMLARPRGAGLPRTARVVPWLLLAAMAAAVYVQGLPDEAAIRSLALTFASPVRTASFVARFLGAGLLALPADTGPSHQAGLGRLVGAIGIAGLMAATALALPHVRRGAVPAPWLRFLAGGAAFSVGCGVAAAVTRGDASAPVASSSRDVALAAPLWLFVAALAVERAYPLQASATRGRGTARAAVVLLLALALASSLSRLGGYAAREAELMPARRALVAGRPDALLARLHPELQPVRDGRAALLRRGLSVFRGGAPVASPPAPPGRLAAPAQRLTLSAPAPVRVTAGAPASLRLMAENTGSETWPSLGADAEATGRVDLGVRFRAPAAGALVAEGVAAELPADVAPGGRVSLLACVWPPALPGRYQVTFSLRQRPGAWFDAAGAPGLALELEVTPPDWPARARAAWRSVRAWLGGPAC